MKRKSSCSLAHLKMLTLLLFLGGTGLSPTCFSLGHITFMCSVAGGAALYPVASENTELKNPAARSVMKQWGWSS